VSVADSLGTALSGRYVIDRELGRGGMATVFLARDLRHARAVAVRVMMRDLVVPAGAERFLKEIQFAARLTHPHVLGVHDSGEADGLLYYVMPYVDGETLRARVAREGALPLADAVRPRNREPRTRAHSRRPACPWGRRRTWRPSRRSAIETQITAPTSTRSA
jgi:serine/threonine-protein kinase